MKGFAKAKFFIAVGLIAATAYLAFFGVRTSFGDLTTTWVKGGGDIVWGMDLRGGVELTLSPPADVAADEGQLKLAQSALEQRLLSKNITYNHLDIDPVGSRIVLHLPWQGRVEAPDPLAAQALARQVDAQTLPFSLTTQGVDILAPTLGAGAKETILLAGKMALGVAALLLVATYRLPGAVTVIALVGQLALITAAVTGGIGLVPALTLTLPGVGGILLGTSLCIRAGIATAQRLLEELQGGRSLDGALEVTLRQVLPGILEQNLAVLLVAILLVGAFGPPAGVLVRFLSPLFVWFGPGWAGALYTFGYTLLAGVAANLVMGVFAARTMLLSLSKQEVLRSPVFYGGAKDV